MLQTFLLLFVPAMEQGLTLGVPLGILFVILRRQPLETYRKGFRTALSWGFWCSIFIVAVRIGTRNAVSREVFEGLAIAIAFLAEMILLWRLWRGKGEQEDRLLKASSCAVALTLFLYHGMELWLMPVGSVISASGMYYSMDLLMKLSGFLLGAVFSFVASYLVYQAADALHDRRLLFVFTVQILACMIQQLIFIIQVLMARQYLTGEALMDVMGPIIDHQSWLIFIIFAAVLVVPLTLFSQPKPERPVDANPAQYRSILAKAIHKRRWGTGVVIALIGMVTASSLGSYIANQKAEIVPAVPVEARDGIVDVPLEELRDGHLHRYVFRASGGEQVRYIVILKSGSAYGVGLDACEICGATGYYERDSQVVCKLCDVQMNKATIGTRGGCNPIPIEYRIEDGKLRVPAEELEKNRKIFR